MLKIESALLDKTSPITLDDLKDQFHRDDWSVSTSPYNVARADNKHAKIYMMIRKYFKEYWAKELRNTGYKHPLRSYSDDYPINLLVKNEGNYIAGTIMEIIETIQRSIIFSIFSSPLWQNCFPKSLKPMPPLWKSLWIH